MRRLLKNIDTLYTCDDGNRILRQAWIIIDGANLAAVGVGASPEGEFDDTLDMAGSVVTPGLINTHHHFFQTLTRALPRAQRGHLLDWLRVLYPVWSAMTPADVAAATAAATSELLLTGATTTVDHFYLIPHCDFAYIEAEVEAARQSGMRLHLVRGSMTSLEGDLAVELTQQLGPRAGGIIDDRSRVLQALNETIRRFHDTSRGSLLTVAVGPTTPTYDDFEFLSAIGELAREADVGIHMHVHPQPSERALCQKRFGKTPFEFLQSAGLLTPRTWFAHCTRINESDVRLLSAHNVGMAHCPRMILRLGARIPPLHLVRAHGMRVAVGVDGAASNDSGSMLGEMRVALLLHRLFDGGGEVPPETWLTPYDLLLMNTRSAAEMIGRTDIGQIAPGYGADVIAFDMRGVEFAGAMLDPLSGLLLAGADSRASLTMVAGVIRVREGRLVEADERELRATVDTASARLLERASASTGTDYASWSLGAAA